MLKPGFWESAEGQEYLQKISDGKMGMFEVAQQLGISFDAVKAAVVQRAKARALEAKKRVPEIKRKAKQIKRRQPR